MTWCIHDVCAWRVAEQATQDTLVVVAAFQLWRGTELSWAARFMQTSADTDTPAI